MDFGPEKLPGLSRNGPQWSGQWFLGPAALADFVSRHVNHGGIEGWADGAAATPFALKFCIIFIDFRLRKIKSVYSRIVLLIVQATPF